ncbi:MAG: rod shape-determining protein RodA [Patescibacteria group bacterium]
MPRRFLQVFQGYDWILVGVVLLLVIIGLASHYASAVNSTVDFKDSFFVKQSIAAAIGLIVLVVVSAVDFRVFRSWSKLLYISLLVLLGTVLVFGNVIRGTKGWFIIGNFSFQPVELAKILFVIALASYLIYIGSPLNFKKTFSSLIVLLPPLMLILMQPDFGSASLFIFTWLVMLAMVPKKITWWIAVVGISIILVIIGWFGLKDYQQSRIQVFLNPQLDPLGQGYNVTQSIIAVGSGQWLGRGLGLGTQSQLDFLPEQQTDFIFASIAEELGLVGASLVLLLFSIFFIRVIRLMRRLRDDFSLLVVGGIISIIFIQVVLNISMNIGLAPVIGLPLPFLSAGGSSLVMSMVIVGMLENLSRKFSQLAPYEQNT